MGFYRTIYYILGLEYIGAYEQKQIYEQRQRKYILLQQIKKNHKTKKITKILIKPKKLKTMSLSEFIKQPVKN